MPNFQNKKTMRKPAYAGINVENGGFCAAMQYNGKIKSECFEVAKEKVDQKIFSWLYKFPLRHYVKIIGAGIVINGDDKRERKLAADIWLKEDIVPILLKNNGGTSEEKAREALRAAKERFKDDNILDIKFDPGRKVIVEEMARLEDFKKMVSKEEFELALKLTAKFKKQRGRLVFFSSTPQGGGVALMRHGLIRFFRQLGVSADWHVMTANEDIFNITKKKFHNVLQNIAPVGTKLTSRDKALYNAWTKKNAEKLRAVFKKAKVIVIDDPQPSGLIPYIKKINPRVKIIFRSHIQIVAELTKKENSAQKITWDFIWKNIKTSDVFVSHPIKEFIPDSVPREKTVLMGAATDELGGLNKKLAKRHIEYYFNMFNEILAQNGQTALDLKRPYIIQVARFDPSKGIPDVLESYRRLRKKLEKENWPKRKIPQLIIAGHGAVDDPEGMPIYLETINTLEMDRYKNFADDIKAARLPHNEQILNALLRGSFIALQLSHKEGYEIKVSEALDKGKPVIAYKTGGIPLQIKNKINGYLVKVGDTGRVADLLYEVFSDKEKYAKLCKNAKEKIERDFYTIKNGIKWLYLATELLEKGKIKGDRRHVMELIEKTRKVKISKYLPMWFADMFGLFKK